MVSVAPSSVSEASLLAHTDIQFHSAVYGVEPMPVMVTLTFLNVRALPQRAMPLSVKFSAWPLPSMVRSLFKLRPKVSASARSLMVVAPSVFSAAASASSKVMYWFPSNSATKAPFLAPAEALAATGAEEGVVAADSAEEATGAPDSFADAASTWGLATVLTEDASTAGSETEAKPPSAKA